MTPHQPQWFSDRLCHVRKGIWRCFLWSEENRKTRRKAKTNNLLSPQMAKSQNRTRAILVGDDSTLTTVPRKPYSPINFTAQGQSVVHLRFF